MRSWHTIYRTWYRSPPTILSCQGSKFEVRGSRIEVRVARCGVQEQATGPVPHSDPDRVAKVMLDAGFISSAGMRSKPKTRAYKMLPDFAGWITSVSSCAVFKTMLK